MANGPIRLVSGSGPDNQWWVGWFDTDGSTGLGCLICGVPLPKVHRLAERHINWHAAHGEHVPGKEPSGAS